MRLARRPNERLLDFGQSLSTLIYEMILFFPFNTERKPFPFDAWPSGRATMPPAPPGAP